MTCHILGWGLIGFNLLTLAYDPVIGLLLAAKGGILRLGSSMLQVILPSILGVCCIAVGAGLRMLASIGMSLREIAGRNRN